MYIRDSLYQVGVHLEGCTTLGFFKIEFFKIIYFLPMLTPRPRWGPSFCRVLCTDSKNQASWIIRITTTAVCTVPLVKLSRSILEQRVHIGKNVTEKELTKKNVSAHSIRRFDHSFFRSELFAEKFLDRTSWRDSSRDFFEKKVVGLFFICNIFLFLFAKFFYWQWGLWHEAFSLSFVVFLANGHDGV